MPTLPELEVYRFVCDFILFMMRAKRTTCARQNTLDWNKKRHLSGYCSEVHRTGLPNSVYGASHVITLLSDLFTRLPLPSLMPASMMMMITRVQRRLNAPFTVSELIIHNYCIPDLHSVIRQLAGPGRQPPIPLYIYCWRFSAVVASFVLRTKLLNVEPG